MSSEAILDILPFPRPLSAPSHIGSALAFIHWQKVLAIMNFIFTNISVKHDAHFYEVLQILVLGLNLSFHLPLFTVRK